MNSLATPSTPARAQHRARQGFDAMRTERSIALIRLAVVAVMTVVYLGSSVDWTPMALSLLTLAAIYAVWSLVAFAGPSEPSMRARLVSILVDLGLVTLWVQATGAADSEYWALYLIVVISVGLRFDLGETLGAALGIATVYVALVSAGDGLPASSLLHRTSLMLITGFAVGVLSHQRLEHHRKEQTLEVLAEKRSRELTVERVEVERLRAADDAKSEFVAVAAHEFRTPLAAVIGVLSTLKEHGAVLAPDERLELLDGASAQAQRLARLVDDLLTVSRIEDGVLRLNPEPVDPRRLLTEAAQVSGTAGRLVIQLRHVSKVWCDPDAVIRVLTNLLDNARKYSPADSKIHISVERQGELVRFGVGDEGPGIPEAERAKVFERFRRLEGGTKKPGVGLGLYICRGLVEAHGGSISVEPSPEGGAEFAFTLPRVARHEEPIGPIALDPPALAVT